MTCSGAATSPLPRRRSAYGGEGLPSTSRTAGSASAPSGAIVAGVKAAASEWVATAPIVTLVDPEHRLVRFYLDDSEMGKAATRQPVHVVFDALPDDTFTGHVTQVEPAVSVIEGVPVVTMWATLDKSDGTSGQRLLAGMNASMKVIAGETKDVVLAPAEALPELAAGQYAVYVVDAKGQLTMRPVQAGLRDLSNAEIVSRLEPGEVVTTGTMETSR